MKNNNYLWITTFDNLWFCIKSRKWTKKPDGESTNCVKVNTLKAAKRRVKKWSKYLPKNTKFILVGKYIDMPLIYLYTK